MSKANTLRIILVLVATLWIVACNPQQPASQQSATHEKATLAPVARAQELVPPVTLNPDKGQEIGFVYEAYLSPHQEGGEEEDTPALVPDQFRSTTPSTVRDERPSRGHGMVRFTKDLSKAYIDIQIEGIKLDEINMFHIHCGRPGMLGPILVDFGMGRNLPQEFADGIFSATVVNDDIVAVSEAGHGIVGFFTAGCPIVPGIPGDVVTVAGMAQIAQQGELYFNLHTTSQTFYGDIRGQLHLVSEP